MANKYCVVIREMPSQDPVNYRFGVATEDLQNGSVVTLGELIDGERELYAASVPAAGTDELWLVTGVELMYKEDKHISEYINEAGHNFRVERLAAGGIYALSVEGLNVANPETDLVKGASVTAGAEAMLTVAATPAEGAAVVGKVIDVFNRAGMKFASIQFARG